VQAPVSDDALQGLDLILAGQEGQDVPTGFIDMDL
jgi:hypothetical protein